MSETDYDDQGHTDEQALEPPNQPSNHPPNTFNDSIEYPSLPKGLPDNRGEKVVDQVLGTRGNKSLLIVLFAKMGKQLEITRYAQNRDKL